MNNMGCFLGVPPRELKQLYNRNPFEIYIISKLFCSLSVYTVNLIKGGPSNGNK